MKYNLKNRPKITEKINDFDEARDQKWLEAYDEYHAEMEYWFEGFEKELRKIADPNNLKGSTHIAIKEILGQ